MNTPARFQFNLSTLLLLTTLAAIVMSAFALAPKFGIALAIMTAMALIHACVAVRRQLRDGRTVGNREKVRRFVAGMAIAYVIVGAFATLLAIVFGILALLFSAS